MSPRRKKGIFEYILVLNEKNIFYLLDSRKMRRAGLLQRNVVIFQTETRLVSYFIYVSVSLNVESWNSFRVFRFSYFLGLRDARYRKQIKKTFFKRRLLRSRDIKIPSVFFAGFLHMCLYIYILFT